MSVQFSTFNSEQGGAGLSIVFSDGTVVPIDSNHPSYEDIKNVLVSSLTSTVEVDEAALLALTQPGIAAGASLTRLSERVTYSNGNIYFDGDLVDTAIAKHIVRVIREGGTTDAYKALVNFLEKIAQNPSEKSKASLYEFIVRHNITINKDGDFHVYKGVNRDGTSIHSGFGIVNGVAQNGNLLNSKGAVIEMPRAKVDADTARGCSTGLHAGTHSYASNFSRGMLLLVKVNPRDVVSVPDDCHFQKIRVSRYEVVDQIEQEIKATTYTTYADDEDDYTLDFDHTVDSIVDALNADYEVQVSFDYTRGDGTTTTVDGLTVNDVTNTDAGQTLVVGVRANGEIRSYRSDRISNLAVTVDGELVGNDDEDEDATDDLNTVDGIENALIDGETVYAQFNFIKVDQSIGFVNNLYVEDVRDSDKGNLIIVGEREDGKVRHYRVDRISNLKGSLTKFDAVPAAVVTPATDAAAPAAGFAASLDGATFFANLAKNTQVNGTPLAQVLDVAASKLVTPAAPVQVLAQVIATVEQGTEVLVNFNYTKLNNNPRALRNFVAQEVRGGYLLIGEREDGEIRSYRIDRITDIEIV